MIARLYEQDRAQRFQVDLDATLRGAEGRPRDVIIENLSETGVRIARTVDLSVGAIVTIGIAGIGMCPVQVVRVAENGYGAVFLQPLHAEQVRAALAAEPLVPIRLHRAAVDSSPEHLSERGARRAELPMLARTMIVVALAGSIWAAVVALALWLW